MNHFAELSIINVNDKVEKKNGLTYLSWMYAWAEVKKHYPDAVYSIKKFENCLPYVFDPKMGYMVFTDMTIEGLTHEMWLPVMDGANKAMKDASYEYTVSQWKDGKKTLVTKNCDSADMFDINKTIMRCLVKNMAMFGLGCYIYAGEDLPEGEEPDEKPAAPKLPLIPAMNRDDKIKEVCKKHSVTTGLFGALLAEMQLDGRIPKGKTAAMSPENFELMLTKVVEAITKTAIPA